MSLADGATGGAFDPFAFTVEGLAARRSARASRDRTLRVSYAPRSAVQAARSEHAATLAARLAQAHSAGRARAAFTRGTPVRPPRDGGRTAAARTAKAQQAHAEVPPAALRESVVLATYDEGGERVKEAGSVFLPGEQRSQPLQAPGPRAAQNLEGVALRYVLPAADEGRGAEGGQVANGADEARQRPGSREARLRGPPPPRPVSAPPRRSLAASQQQPSARPRRPLSAAPARQPKLAATAPAAGGAAAAAVAETPTRPRSAPPKHVHASLLGAASAPPRLRTPAERLAQRMSSAGFVPTRRNVGRGAASAYLAWLGGTAAEDKAAVAAQRRAVGRGEGARGVKDGSVAGTPPASPARPKSAATVSFGSPLSTAVVSPAARPASARPASAASRRLPDRVSERAWWQRHSAQETRRRLRTNVRNAWGEAATGAGRQVVRLQQPEWR